MNGIMAAHEGHAYIDMVEGPPREISEVIHHTYRMHRTVKDCIRAHCIAHSITCFRRQVSCSCVDCDIEKLCVNGL